MRILTILGTVCIAACLVAPGCKKAVQEDDDDATAETPTPETSVTEEGENGTIAWDVTTSGQVRAAIKAPDGRAIAKDITGTLTFPGHVGDQVCEVAVDDKGFLVAHGPPLEDDLTQIEYALVVEGKPWAGAIHVPRGGTREIQEDAKLATNMGVPPGKTGPNGGAITLVGDQPVEVVADRDSEQIRVYALDRDYGVVEPGERSFSLGFSADYPGTEMLVREPGAAYYVGPWYAGYDPFRVTVAMTFGGVTRVGVVGWRAGESFRVGVGAPGVAFAGRFGWAPSVAVRAGVGFGVGFGCGIGVSAGFGAAFAVGGGVRGGVGVGVAGRVGGREAVGVAGREGGRMGGRDEVRGGGHEEGHAGGHEEVHGGRGGPAERGGGRGPSAPSHWGGGGHGKRR